MNAVTFPPILLSSLLFLSVFTCAEVTSPCSHIDEAFKQSAKANDLTQPACQCFLESSKSVTSAVGPQETEVWVGCAGQKMPHVFSALNALNESVVSKLWIWDSLINIVPTDLLAQIRPRILSIQRSKLSVFRPNAFSKVGQRLKVLELRHNILKELDPSVFQQLMRLEVLNLGENKIGEVLKGQLDALKELKTLIISDNHLKVIEDGAFQALKNLKVLNLANNRLQNITSGTFRGLDNLEELYLQGNSFTTIDWKAFGQLKNLKILDLGNNQLVKVEFHGLESLEKLLINNNSIESMKDVVLRDLSNLKVLSVDRNLIARISEDDLHSLGECRRLISLSMVFNQLKAVDTRALEPIHNLQTLSLQNNHLSSLSNDIDSGKVSFLRPLGKLKQLYLGFNDLTEVMENDLSSLRSLETLELDNNQIEKIDKEAFSGLPLSHLYLANNHLSYLSKGVFDFAGDGFEVIDLSGNPWTCICGEEWLPQWLEKMEGRVLHRNLMGCMQPDGCDTQTATDTHSPVVTIAASILAVISIIILFAIAFLYFEDGKRIRRASSDLLHLISNTDEVKQPLDENEGQVKPLVMGSGKKRVRFDGV